MRATRGIVGDTKMQGYRRWKSEKIALRYFTIRLFTNICSLWYNLNQNDCSYENFVICMLHQKSRAGGVHNRNEKTRRRKGEHDEKVPLSRLQYKDYPDCNEENNAFT